jgi:hypothetical protein
MSEIQTSPRVIKGGLVLIDADSGAIRRVISLQYNPETLTRTLQSQQAGAEGVDRSEALRLKGPPVETFRLEAEIDATDQLEFPDQNATATQVGIHPQLAALETMLYPASADLVANGALAESGALEIIPMQAPLALFVWSKSRIAPVRVTEFSITEEAFDTALNPIRAKVTLGLRVLSVDDLGFAHRGASLFMSYLRNKESLAGRSGGVGLSTLGLRELP